MHTASPLFFKIIFCHGKSIPVSIPIPSIKIVANERGGFRLLPTMYGKAMFLRTICNTVKEGRTIENGTCILLVYAACPNCMGNKHTASSSLTVIIYFSSLLKKSITKNIFLKI